MTRVWLSPSGVRVRLRIAQVGLGRRALVLEPLEGGPALAAPLRPSQDLRSLTDGDLMGLWVRAVVEG